MYRTPPGLRPYVAVEDAGPVRGARNVEGRLLVVMGNELFQISNTGVAIPRGTIPGVGPVQLSHNQQGNSNQVIIVNGSAGYIYDTATLDVTRITDAGYPGAKSVDYLASYFLQVEPSGQYWFHSDLADGFAYNTPDRYESEAKPDRIVAVKSSQLEVVAFNQTTIEFFTNTGAATGTFQSKGIVIETGCASANGIVELDNSLMWLDNKGVFQRMEGYGARPISTRVLERAIAGYDWSSAIAFVWEDRGHKVAYWTFRDGFTVGYDVTTGLWHRRASYSMDRWRLSCLVNWNDKWIGGDFQTGKLYELDWDYPYDGQDPMVRRAVTGALHNEQRRMSVPSIELVFDTGGPSVEVADFPAQPEGPTITGDAPDGAVGVPYSAFPYTLSNGTPPYLVTLRSGAFPTNLGPISSAGVIPAVTPAQPSVGTFRLRNTDANGLYSELTDTIQIASAMLVTGTQTASSSPSAAFSADASAWTPITDAVMPITSPATTYGGGRWVCVIKGEGWYSDNLGTWTQSASVPGSGGVAVAAGHGNGVFIVVGSSGIVYRSTNNSVNYSAITDTGANYLAIAYGNGRWIAGVQGTTHGPYRTSIDGGVTWSQGSAVFPNSVSCALWNGELWAIGGGDNTPTDPGGIKTSPDGVAWSAGITSPSQVWSVAYGNGIWVALCYSGEILYSDDDWVTFSTSATTVSDTSRSTQVCFNGFEFVLCESNGFSEGITRTSVDGNTWSSPVLTGIKDNLIIVSNYEYV